MNNFEKEINELWNSNSKIPFMQSKEILGLGYLTAANKYIKQTVNKEENTKEKSPVISSDNDDQKEYSVNKNKDKMKTAKFSKKSKSEDNYKNEKTIELRTLENVLAYIKKSGHLLDTYNYIDNKVQNLKNEICISY